MWKDRTMTLFILKIIAIITMTTDHAASAFFDNMMVMRVIGRIAFLLYAFMIAEGFYHIKDKPDRIKAHLIKLGMLCVISEFAYDFMEEGKLIDWSSQSVMPVLFLGFIGLPSSSLSTASSQPSNSYSPSTSGTPERESGAM